MDDGWALVIAALIAASPSIAALILTARNGKVLAKIAPTLAQVEINTNSNTTTIEALAKKEGIRIGTERGRAAATAEGVARAEGLAAGQAQPQTPVPAVAPIDGT